MIVIVSVVCGLEIKWVNFEIATEILRPGGLELKLRDGHKINIVVLKSVLMDWESIRVILKSVHLTLIRLVFHQFME